MPSEDQHPCLEHSMVIEAIKDIKELWKTLESKVSQKLFYLVVMALVAILASNVAIYSRLGSVEAKLEISTVKVDSHIEYDNERHKSINSQLHLLGGGK